jgi:hypothetical protein
MSVTTTWTVPSPWARSGFVEWLAFFRGEALSWARCDLLQDRPTP